MNLEFGFQQTCPCSIPAERLIAFAAGPEPRADFPIAIREVLRQPLEFPPLVDAIVPGDKVLLVLDRDLPQAEQIVAEIWPILAARGVSASDVCLLHPADWRPLLHGDPRRTLPSEIAEQMTWKTHDPTDEKNHGYLGSTAGGERIYLAREVLDADFILPICRTTFDPLCGYRHAASMVYPGLSNTATLSKLHGQGHSELRPEDERPIRQAAEEVLWMLGVQFTLQTVPASTGSAAAAIFAGSADATARASRELLDQRWRILLPERVETVVLTLTHGGEGATWDDVGTALAAGRQLVNRGGRLVVISDLKATPGPGLEILRECRLPRDAMSHLRKQSPPDLLCATQLALATDFAQVYLLSALPSDLVEEHFMIPLENVREVSRLLESAGDCAAIIGGQFAHGELTPST